jgi:hypothetical protein
MINHDLEKILQPVWQGSMVYHESLMFVPDARTGEIQPGRLLYEPNEIILVRSADFMVEYRQDRDYQVIGNHTAPSIYNRG